MCNFFGFFLMLLTVSSGNKYPFLWLNTAAKEFLKANQTKFPTQQTRSTRVQRFHQIQLFQVLELDSITAWLQVWKASMIRKSYFRFRFLNNNLEKCQHNSEHKISWINIEIAQNSRVQIEKLELNEW